MPGPRLTRTAWRGSRPSKLATLLLAAMSVAACNLVTGSSAYQKTESCTGPTCGNCAAGEYIDAKGFCTACPSGGKGCGPTCCASAQTCLDASTGTCGCDPNVGAAGPIVCGSNCCSVLTPNCVEVNVSETETTLRCSACDNAALECGKNCCLQGQTCVSQVLGACEGAPFGVPKQSCSGGLECPVPDGKGGTEMADCCESIAMPESTFWMGGDPEKKPPEGDDRVYPVEDAIPFPATVSAYSLDRFEVTVGRFRKFVEAYGAIMASGGPPGGAGRDPNLAVEVKPRGAGWQEEWNQLLPPDKAKLVDQFDPDDGCTYRDTPGENDSLPVNCVTWFEAFAFCAWDGGWLPTEAEWEMAATNGNANTLYPWGDAPSPGDTLGVYCIDEESGCPEAPNGVGSKPAGANLFGHRDLAGNVFEWVLDGEGAYPLKEDCSTPESPCTNYARPGQDFCLSVRGGSYNESYYYLRASYRDCNPAKLVDAELGLRCARKPLLTPSGRP
jgi:formylglycine-generating enzyme